MRWLEQLRERFNWRLAKDAKGKSIYVGSLVDDLEDPYDTPMYVAGILDGSLTVIYGPIIGDRQPSKVVVVGWRA